MPLPKDIPYIPNHLPSSNTLMKPIILGIIGLIIASQFLVIVPAGERAVLFNIFTGVEEYALPEGMHFKLPVIHTAYFYDVRTNAYTMSASHDEGEQQGDDAMTALTADGQVVKMDVTLRYHLQPDKVWRLHREIGPNIVSKIVRPQIQMAVRTIIADHIVQAVYSKDRALIQQQITQKMTKSLSRYFINLDDVLIRNISFSEAFTQAIEQKQVAFQEAERMKYVLQKEESEKKRKIIAATGESEAIRLRANALRQNPQLIQYEYVQKLSPNIKAIVADQKTIMNFADIFKP